MPNEKVPGVYMGSPEEKIIEPLSSGDFQELGLDQNFWIISNDTEDGLRKVEGPKTLRETHNPQPSRDPEPGPRTLISGFAAEMYTKAHKVFLRKEDADEALRRKIQLN